FTVTAVDRTGVRASMSYTIHTIYAPAGLDTTFGSGSGFVTSSSSFVSSLVIQPDGKIVIAGGTYVPSGTTAFLARYYPKGSLDSTFGTGGIVNGPTSYALVGVALQADGKIVVSEYPDNNTTRIVRYNSNGSLDSSFGPVTLDIRPNFSGVNLAIQP